MNININENIITVYKRRKGRDWKGREGKSILNKIRRVNITDIRGEKKRKEKKR